MSKPILSACLPRQSSSKPLGGERGDFPETDPERDRCFITIRREGDRIVRGEVPQGYFGDLETEYLKRNGDYVAARNETYGEQ